MVKPFPKVERLFLEIRKHKNKSANVGNKSQAEGSTEAEDKGGKEEGGSATVLDCEIGACQSLGFKEFVPYLNRKLLEQSQDKVPNRLIQPI